MSINVIMTLIMAFTVVVFSLFNAEVVTINLIGYKTVSLPMSFLVFFVFIIGAGYAAILSFQRQIEQSLKIRKLKKTLKSLKEIPAADTIENATDKNLETGKSAERFTAVSETKAPVVPGDNSKESTAEGEPQEWNELSHENEAGLSSERRGIALRRIQNV